MAKQRLADQLRDQFEKARATSPLGRAVPVIGDEHHLDATPFADEPTAEIAAFVVYYLAVLEDVAVGLAEEVDELRKQLARLEP